MPRHLSFVFVVACISLLLTSSVLAAEIIVAEGEQFAPLDQKGWRATHQEDSWASHTYGGMWVVQGGLLGAPADSVDSVATKKIAVPAAGDYRVWSKYQAPPYFNFMHKLEIVQKGKTLFSYVYGKVDADRMWSFAGQAIEMRPYRQIWWTWGVDHDAGEAPANPVHLEAGEAELRLITVKQDQPAGDRMVDCIVLTTDMTDAFGAPRALVNVASAAGPLFMRFQNTAKEAARLTVSISHKCQPDYGAAGGQIPNDSVAPGQWSAWVNIAPFTTWVHDVPVSVSLPNAPKFRIQFARDAGGNDLSGDLTVTSGQTIIVPIDVTWNKKAEILTSQQHAERLMAVAKGWRTANGGKKPQQILYFGAFPAGQGNGPWVMALKDALGYNTGLPDAYAHAPADGYHQHCHDMAQLTDYVTKMTPAQKQSFKMMSFGDEIGISPVDTKDPAIQNAFAAWLKAKGVTQADLGADPAQAPLANPNNSPRIAWYAQQFGFEQAVSGYKAMTQYAKAQIGPQVETGANYSPHGLPQYYGNVPMYVDVFKQGGMTMFWTEDYIFSVAQPPQFLSWQFALMHCGTKYNKQPIHMYVMPHAPGQLPEYFRRSMVFAVGAGARHIDSFWVAPMESFTENFISWTYPEQFKVLHESIFDSAEVEPYQINGTLRPARIALVYGRATDYNESRSTFAPAQDQFLRRASNPPKDPAQNICREDQQLLYLALTHTQHAVDLITEDDIVDGILKNYAVVYFAGEWIDNRVPPILEKWINGGGILYATAGLGCKNQFNEPYDGLLKLLGLKSCTIEKDLYIARPYLELALAQPIDVIKVGDATIPAIGLRQELKTDTAQVLGTWRNGRPAVTINTIGNGKAIAVGTLAGHTYLKPALHTVPWARGGRKMVYNPTDFDQAATELARLGVDAIEVPREVECSIPLVEALVMDSAQGALVTLVNWTNEPIKGLKVAVKMPAEPKAVRSVQQQKDLVGSTYANGQVSFTTDLEWGDYFLMPRK